MTILLSSLQHITPLKPLPPPPPPSLVPAPTDFHSLYFVFPSKIVNLVQFLSSLSLYNYYPFYISLLLYPELIHSFFVYKNQFDILIDWYPSAHFWHMVTNQHITSLYCLLTDNSYIQYNNNAIRLLSILGWSSPGALQPPSFFLCFLSPPSLDSSILWVLPCAYHTQQYTIYNDLVLMVAQ